MNHSNIHDTFSAMLLYLYFRKITVMGMLKIPVTLGPSTTNHVTEIRGHNWITCYLAALHILTLHPLYISTLPTQLCSTSKLMILQKYSLKVQSLRYSVLASPIVYEASKGLVFSEWWWPLTFFQHLGKFAIYAFMLLWNLHAKPTCKINSSFNLVGWDRLEIIHKRNGIP